MKKPLIPTIISCISIATLFISSPIAMMTNASADDLPSVDDDITITVDSACTMGQTVTSAHTTELNPGETNTTIGQSRIAAYCNDNEGYAIYAIGYTNSEYGNTSLVSTDGNHTIPTGTSGNNAYWNMRLTQGTASGTTSYLPTMVNEFTTNTTIPDDYTKVAYRDSSTISQNQDPTETGSYFTTTYEAHIDTTQPAGIYTGQVQYVMVHPSGAPEPEKPKTIDDLTYMQDFATLSESNKANVRSSMIVDQQYILEDVRDYTKYFVSKLKDGNVWMTQNLDLDLSRRVRLTPENTDISSDWTPTYDTIHFTGTSVTGWSNNVGLPYSADPGNIYYYSSNTTDSDEQYTSLAACQADHPDCSAHNHAGNYYNWPAAVASVISSPASQYNNAPGSICPAGWRLPIVRDGADNDLSYEWGSLLAAEGIMADPTDTGYSSYTTEGFNNIRISPLWLTRSGIIDIYSQLSSTGGIGSYWSSTVSDRDYAAYGLYFYSSSVNQMQSWPNHFGLAVRCLLR